MWWRQLCPWQTLWAESRTLTRSLRLMLPGDVACLARWAASARRPQAVMSTMAEISAALFEQRIQRLPLHELMAINGSPSSVSPRSTQHQHADDWAEAALASVRNRWQDSGLPANSVAAGYTAPFRSGVCLPPETPYPFPQRPSMAIKRWCPTVLPIIAFWSLPFQSISPRLRAETGKMRCQR
jgi:hypothetical protein